MTGSEILGEEELREIQELFNKDKVILYRYGPGNYKTKLFEEIFSISHTVASKKDGLWFITIFLQDI